MKFLNNIKRFLAVLTVSVIAVSCDSDNNEGITKYPTAEEFLKSQSDYKVFLKAITKTDLLSTFRNPGSYTYFVANDAALAPLTEASIDAMSTTQLADLKKIMQYHILSLGTVSSDLVANGYTKTFSPFGSSTSNTLSMFVGVKNGETRINDFAKITEANIQTSNGVIHKIDKQLFFPKLMDLIAPNPKLSKFTAMLTATTGTYGDQTAVLNVVKANGPTTVFAPNDDAVVKATDVKGFFTGALVNQANTTKLLQYHLANTNLTASSNTSWTSSSATANVTITTLAATAQKFEIEKGTLKIKELPTPDGFATIETVNVQASNGALHIINKVLKPVLP